MIDTGSPTLQVSSTLCPGDNGQNVCEKKSLGYQYNPNISSTSEVPFVNQSINQQPIQYNCLNHTLKLNCVTICSFLNIEILLSVKYDIICPRIQDISIIIKFSELRILAQMLKVSIIKHKTLLYNLINKLQI